MKTVFLRILFVAFTVSMLSALPAVAENEQTTKVVTKGIADSVTLQRASISFADEVLLHDMDLSISSIDSTAVPELDYGMFNVSVEGEGFRFLPHGIHFGGDGATIKLGYDRTRIPSGYTEDDIRTYYYDTDKKNWVALQLVEVDKQQACVVSKTTHFTDMINGVIVAPESPETSAFTPTMMNDIKAADPTSKINIITPPTANNRGSANLQYPFEMPPARNGMQPQVALSYNSDGGSGWAGEGWDISIPSITVDTRWGVPRYNTTYETETYLLNGQMLAMMNGNEMTVAHRTDSVLRQENRQFFMRQGGDFSLIIREGNSIDNYYWVVTDRNGVKYTYGGDANARLSGTYTDVNGNQRQVIAEWKLTRIEEPHGDYIEYVYNNIDEDTISSNLRTKAIYLSQINAGNAGSLPHTKVTFKSLNAKKTIKINNARYGFLTSSSQLLDSVLVEFKSSGSYEKLRSYKLEYEDGPFYKRLLSRVSHRDNFGNEVSYQEFDYYNDVSISNQNITQFEDDFETIDIGGNSSNNILQYLTDTPTALGGTATTSWGLSFYAGIGAIDGSQWKGNTVGASYSYSHDTSEGQTAFIDLNGDGLPDKVYVQNGNIYYCPQYISSNNNQSFFDNPVRVNGISSISKTTSKTHTYSVVPKFVIGWMDLTGEYSREKATTKTESTEYFNDINGDGLVDFVSKGKVYFNHLDNNGVPTFTLSSGDTPSPIIYDREIDTSLYTPDIEEQHELLQNSPMIDVVRVWQAPKDCNIIISGFIQRILPQGQYDEDEYAKADSLRVSIECNGDEWWGQSIEKGDTTKYYPSSTSSASSLDHYVNKDDKIFFRVQCGTDSLSNGAFDNVKWSPIITILETETNPIPELHPNGYESNVYTPEEGAIYDVNTFARIENCTQFNLSGIFIKPITTDDVVIRIIGKDDKYDSLGNENPNYREGIVFEQIFPSTTIVDTLINAVVVNQQLYKNFHFEISSESNVDWAKVKWIPSVTYIENSSDTISINVPAHYKLYATCVNEGEPFWCSASDSICVINPFLLINDQSLNGQVTVTVKSRHRLIAKHTYEIVNGVFQNNEAISFVKTSNGFLWVEFFFNGIVNEESFVSATYRVSKRAPQNSNLQELIPRGKAYFYAEHQDEGFGLMYRGWGGFAYNAANGRYAHPIDVSLLSLPQDTTERINPLTMPFNQLGTDQGSLNKWVGQNGNIYLTAYEAGAARLTEQDVKMTNPLINEFEIASESGTTLTGTGAKAINQISNSSSTIDQEGFLSLLTFNQAEGAAETKQTMMDLNGDGFPDILSYGTVQYTNSHGGLSGEIINIELEKSNNSSSYRGIGGIPVGSVSNIIELIKNGNVALQNAQTEWGAQMSVNGGENRNYDEAVVQFIDVNGDGLPDKVTSLNDSSNKFVCLNMGYSFTSPVSWNMETIQKGSSVTGNGNVSGGAGGGILGVTNNNTTNTQINKASGSFSVGIGFSDSWSYESYRLLDVNGDGLPDKIKTTGNDFTSNDSVALNLGDRFDDFVLLNGINAISASSSSAASANVAFTVTINIPIAHIKICANPGASLGYSVNRPFYSLQDVDGDGFIDVVTSSSENDLKVRKSSIARTNKLRTVTNSLGGRFTLDYKHNTPTYGLPGGKWVMSSVEIDYGIHGDYEIPNTKNVFEYNNGRRDRHEREFLGFGQVITKNIDTQNNMALYRQTVEEYDTSSIYSAGNLLHSYITKPTGNKLTEVSNDYYSYGLTNTAASGVNGGKYKFSSSFPLWNDRGAAYCPLKYTRNTQYEGGSEGAIMSESWSSYYTGHGDHGLLSDYRYSDKGTLGSSGTGSYDYHTSIDYNSKLSDTCYYFGQPSQVTVSGSNDAYHLVQATYSSAYPTQLTSVKRAVKSRAIDPNTPMNPNVGDGLNGGMRPGLDPFSTDPDTHGFNTYSNNLDFAETSYSYDAYGNLTKVTLPVPSDGSPRRPWYEFTYEDTLSTHIRDIRDAFLLTTHNGTLDLRYGLFGSTVDRNGQVMETSHDNLGRTTCVTTPIDLEHHRRTMDFSYHQFAETEGGRITVPAYSVTRYYLHQSIVTGGDNSNRTDTMRVVTFVDGFGRPIQVRKDGVVWNGSQNVDSVIVTGKTVYDSYGRAVGSYYPSTDSPSSVMTFEPSAQSGEYVTLTEYDELDRPLLVRLPDETYTTYAYSLDGNNLKTTVTDAEGHSTETYTNGSGKTVRSVQYMGEGNTVPLSTLFGYDGIGRLVSVTDPEGNVTESTYDYGDRRTRVVHPASGETSYTYDRLGNVLTVQTANLKNGNKHMEYSYDRGRLASVTYPEHPEHNVYYHYGDSLNTSYNLKGRLAFKVDGSGGTEYHYDAMGNVAMMRRTLLIPDSLIATADFYWTYDSFGKLLSMTYPKAQGVNELVAYRYDRSGQLQHVLNGDTNGYPYALDIGYDRFGSQTHIQYGNGTETSHEYISTNRRLKKISVSSVGGFVFGRTYGYDDVGNILTLTSSNSSSGTLFPPVRHDYVYDPLYRLTSAVGITESSGPKSALYEMTMEYDSLYRVKSKKLDMSRSCFDFSGTLSAGYDLGYSYSKVAGRKFQMSSVDDVNYRVASAIVSNSDKINERHTYEYDSNGNITYAGTARKRGDRAYRGRTREEKFRWDEENRLLAISQDGYVSHYVYDSDGERTVKLHRADASVFVNGGQSAYGSGDLQFTAYFDPTFCIHNGTRFTKHIYIGSDRIASITGPLNTGYSDLANVPSGNNITHAGVGLQFNTHYNSMLHALSDSIEGDYAYFSLPDSHISGSSQPRVLMLTHDGEEGSSGSGNTLMAPTPRSQSVPAEYGGVGDIWYYHKDHLGSSVLVTDSCGLISQQVEYLPYGEVFLESLSIDRSVPPYATPYKFNGKELDEETGLYYYGARYMNPRLSIWYATDPLQEETLFASTYSFCNGNPINRTDNDGKFWETAWDVGNVIYDVGAAIYHHATGDHDAAKSDWVDAGADLLAAIIPVLPAGSTKIIKGGEETYKIIDKANTANKQRKNVTKMASTRKHALQSRPKPKPAESGKKRVTNQIKNKNGEGNKFKTDKGKQSLHVHDRNHKDKTKPNVHYRYGKNKHKKTK